MEKTDLINRYSSTPEQKISFAHIIDIWKRSENRNIAASSNFLSEADSEKAGEMLRAAGAKNFLMYGGYDGAERKCAVFFPDYYSAETVISDASVTEIAFLEINTNKFDAARAGISHRDCLGALMSLGIERELIGDIAAEGSAAVIVIKSSIRQYLEENLEKIGRYNIIKKFHESFELDPPQNFEEKFDTAASLRLDAITAAMFDLSRSQAAESIRRGLVAINGTQGSEADFEVSQGDKISLKGKGKIQLAKIDGESKKGRIRLIFRKFK